MRSAGGRGCLKSLLENYELNLTKRMLVVKQDTLERNLSRR